MLDRAAEHGPFRALSQAGCPIRIAWAQHDHLLPWGSYGRSYRDVVPGAEFVRLPGVGHVPMWDDPELVARTILQVTARPPAQAG